MRVPPGSVDDLRASWPQLPRPSLAQRLRGRRGRRLVDRIERLRFRRGLPFPVGADRVVVRRDGRLQVVTLDPRATGRSAARANLDLVVDVCELEGIDYFLDPSPNALTSRLGVETGHWDALVAALARRGEREPVYAAVNARTRSRSTRWSEQVTEPGLAAAMRAQDEYEVFRPVATDAKAVPLGRQWSCRVTRWRTDDDDRLIASGRGSRAQSVSRLLASTTVIEHDGRPVTTLDVFTEPNVFDVTFPIDVVYLWVDGEDPAWLARKQAALAAAGVTGTDAGSLADARFRDGGELRCSLRSLEQYSPWVRRVFLVTDGQVPTWLNRDEPRLTVVDHRELFGDAGTLPTFNSHAIGARLHHIDGLAEHYLYLNDDVFFGRDVAPSAFFEANGQARIFLSKLGLSYSDDSHRLAHESARRNVADLIQRDFGVRPSHIFYHSPIPQRRSTMTELEQRYPDEFARTWNNQFRAHTDIEPNSWLHGYYGYLTGRTIPSRIGYTYIELGRPGAERQLARLARTRDRDVFCVNDHADATPEQHAFAARWLARYFPVPSRFEW